MQNQLSAVHLAYLETHLLNEKIQFEHIRNNNGKTDDLLSSLNNIIELKKLLKYIGDDSIYLDYKHFFELYLKAVEEQDSGYDHVSINHIIEKLKYLESSERVNSILVFKRQLLLHGYYDLAKECDDYINQARFEGVLSLKKNIKNILNIVILWSALSKKNLLIVLALFYVFVLLILLPSPVPQLVIFNSDSHSYSDVRWLNYLLNVLTLFFDLDEGMRVGTNCSFGIIAIIVGKIFYIAILINYFVKNLIKRFESN